MKYLGIDYGEAKIGLAIGDIESGVAAPFGMIKNSNWDKTIDMIKEMCEKERIEKIVIGIPVNPQVKHSKQIDLINHFIVELAKVTELEVVGQDERFSTQEAQKLINKGKSNDDDLSAMLILQNYFDSTLK